MPPPAASSDAPAAAEDNNAAAATDNAAGGGGSRRSLRARPQHVSYRDDELAWEALFKQDSDDDDDGRGDDDELRGGEQRPKGKRGRPPKNQGERVGPVETVLGPSGRQVRGIWGGATEREREGEREKEAETPPSLPVEVRGFSSSFVSDGGCFCRNSTAATSSPPFEARTGVVASSLSTSRCCRYDESKGLSARAEALRAARVWRMPRKRALEVEKRT